MRIHIKLFSLTDTRHLNAADFFHQGLCRKVLNKVSQVKESEITFLALSLFIWGSAPKVNVVYSGPRPKLHPGFLEIHLVVFVKSC